MLTYITRYNNVVTVGVTIELFKGVKPLKFMGFPTVETKVYVTNTWQFTLHGVQLNELSTLLGNS